MIATGATTQEDLEMLNQALKGMACAFGSGNGLTRSATAISLPSVSTDLTAAIEELSKKSAHVEHRATIVVASKFLSYLEGRVLTLDGSFQPVRNPDRSERQRILSTLAPHGVQVDERDVIMLDHGFADSEWVLGPEDPNTSAHQLMLELERATGLRCEVVVSDSGAGPTKGQALIGCPTFIATPVGATSGVSLPHAQRYAATAEILFNGNPLSPLVLIEADEDHRRPIAPSSPRYSGFLDATREQRLLLK